MAEEKQNTNENIQIIPESELSPEAVSEEISSDSKLIEEAKKFKNEYLYLRAEFDNYKKNAIKERSDLIKYGSERLMAEVLNILDIFDRALSTEVTSENIESFKEGMNLTANEFQNVLQKFEVKEIDSLGQPFDPAKHDALSSEETTEIEEGHISQVITKGYSLHSKIIRPSQVIVAKKPKEDPSKTLN